MKHTGTVEFRCFRSSIHERHIADSFRFVEKFMDAALNNGPDVLEILQEYEYQFPPFNYDHEMYIAWEKTKYDKSRGEKKREYHEVA